jgi:hypothetical protein
MAYCHIGFLLCCVLCCAIGVQVPYSAALNCTDVDVGHSIQIQIRAAAFI